jgi:hypothetical protein
LPQANSREDEIDATARAKAKEEDFMGARM